MNVTTTVREPQRVSKNEGLGQQRRRRPDRRSGFSDSTPASRRQGREVDMTPMVDVTFLLLIFFMVSASFQLQKSIAVPPQQSENSGEQADDVPPPGITVQIDDRGAFLVMTPDWEFEPIGKQNLITTLKRAVTEAHGAPGTEIQVDESAKLEALVLALDAVAAAGAADVRVTQVDYL